MNIKIEYWHLGKTYSEGDIAHSKSFEVVDCCVSSYVDSLIKLREMVGQLIIIESIKFNRDEETT